MKLTVLVDNLCCGLNILTEWGYSAHLETPSGNILIDTSEHAHVLLHNMRELQVYPEKIDHIFLSHGHSDHCGGLSEVLKYAPHAPVWCSEHIAVERRAGKTPETASVDGGGLLLQTPNFNRISEEAEIVPGVIAFSVPTSERDPAFVYTQGSWEVTASGELKEDTFADDMSLLVKGDFGYSLVLGCTHAGLPNTMSYVRHHFGIASLYMVVGGTHLALVGEGEIAPWIDALRETRVQRWRPNHCTGFKAAAKLAGIFADVDWAGAGTVLEL